jgi:hypothetical protein
MHNASTYNPVLYEKKLKALNSRKRQTLITIATACWNPMRRASIHGSCTNKAQVSE